MMKRLKLSFMLSLFSPFMLYASANGGASQAFCGYYELQGEGLYDGFIFRSATGEAIVLSIENFKSPYYIKGNIVHIPHNRGGEFLLEIQQEGKVLRGKDFWTNGTAYKEISNEGCL